jgi:WD40 repeat protein
VFADRIPAGAGLGFDPESGDIYFSEGGEIRWFDPGNGEPGGREQVPEAKEMSLLPSPDGRMFAYGATAADVWLWDRNREEEVAHLHDPGGAIPAYEMLFSPDSETIAVVQETSVRLWDLASERYVEFAPPLRDSAMYMSQATAFSPDSRLIAAGAANGCVYIWEVASGELTRPGLCGNPQPVTSLAFSHASDHLVTGDEDGQVRIWSLAGRTRQTPAPRSHRDVVAALAFSSDDERVASVGDDGVLSLWDVGSGRSVQYGIERNPGISNYSGQRAFDELAFDADGETLVTIREGEGRVWDASPDGAFGEPVGYGSEVEGDAISPDGKLIVVRKDDWAEVWDRRTDERVSISEPGILGDFEFSADGESALAADDGYAMVWDAATGVLQHELEHTVDPHVIGSGPNVALSPDRRLIVTTKDYADDKGEDFGVRVWRTSDGGLLESLRSGFDYEVSDVAFSPDGELLAATGVGEPFRGTIQVWDTSTWRPVARRSVRKDRLISGFVFSPDGEMLATTGEPDPVRLWTVPDLRPFGRPLFGDVDAAPAIAFSADGQTLATGGEDGKVRLWDVATQEMLGQPLPAHDELVNTLRFSSDGKELITMGSPATLRTWDSILWAADYSQLQTLICNAIGHDLSHADWEQLVPEEPYHATCP